MTEEPELSIIIPVYNEEQRLEKGLSEVLRYLRKQQFSWELIVVDDGSADQTVAIAEKIFISTENALLIKNPHLGKGGAIKKGVLSARGRWLIFLDVDLATPIEELKKFMQLRKNYDIIIGSRKMKGSRILVHQPRFREFGGKIFTALTNAMVTKGISDITCGFKLYRTEIAQKLFREARLSDWSFDAEIIFLAQKMGARIREAPVSWRDDPHTKVTLLKDTLNAFLGLVKIRFNDWLGKYHLS